MSVVAISLSIVPASASDQSAAEIQELKKRIERLERLLEKRLSPPQNQVDQSGGGAVPIEGLSSGAAGLDGNSSAAASPVPPAPRVEKKDDSFNSLGQEAFVERDNVPTLKAKKLEVSAELAYTKNEASLQNERAVQLRTSIRYGLTDRLELGLSIPVYYTFRNTRTGIGSSSSYDVKGFGDTVLSASYLVASQKDWWPGVSFSAGVIAPTGESPYNFGPQYQPGRNPVDVLRGYQSTAHWGTSANVQFFKTMDPIVLFWGGGTEYLFSKDVQGHEIDRGFRFNANLGASMALSENSTIASTLNFSYAPEFKVDGTKVAGSDSESFSIRTVVVQRIPDTSIYLEPSVSFGLTDNAADVVVGLGVRKRW